MKKLWLFLISAGVSLALTQTSMANPNNSYDSNPESICSNAAVLFCEDWDHNTYNHLVDLNSTWDWSSGDQAGYGAESDVICTNVGYNSPCALQMRIAQNAPETIFPRHNLPSEQTDWLYARFYIKFSPGYVFYPSQDGAAKIAYFESNSNNTGYWRLQLGLGTKDGDQSHGYWFFDPNIHTNYYRCNSNPLCEVVPNTWYAVEMAAKANTVRGTANGALKLWINGTLVIDQSNVEFKNAGQAGNNNGDGFDTFWLTGYFGGPTVNHPTQYQWYDNIVVSTQPIGPLGAPTPPSPPPAPTSLIVNP